jgi:hypothetical protein
MTHTARRIGSALAFGAMFVGVPVTVGALATSAPASAACAVGMVDRDGGCVPYCGDNTLLDTKSGQCRDPLSAIVSDYSGVPNLPPPPALPEIPPPTVNVGLPGIGLPGIGIGIAPPALPGPPPHQPICGPGIQTPIPMVGFTPCI